ESCTDCRAELAGLRSALALFEQDPAHRAEPPISAGALAARVKASLDEPAPARVGVGGWGWALGAALASLILVALGVVLLLRPGAPSGGVVAERAPTEAPGVASDELLRRMERQMSREQAVRYLSDAQDVLVTLAATPQKCRRGQGRIDVGEEARRSRELLERRALLLDLTGDEVAS